MALWSWMPDWNSPLSETLKWSTSESSGHNGLLDSHRSLWQHPQRSISFSVSVLPQEVAAVRDFLRENQGTEIDCPLWQYANVITATVETGGGTFPVDYGDTSGFQIGKFLLWAGTDYYDLISSGGTAPRQYPRGSLLIPVGTAICPTDVSQDEIADDFGSFSLSFDYTSVWQMSWFYPTGLTLSADGSTVTVGSEKVSWPLHNFESSRSVGMNLSVDKVQYQGSYYSVEVKDEVTSEVVGTKMYVPCYNHRGWHYLIQKMLADVRGREGVFLQTEDYKEVSFSGTDPLITVAKADLPENYHQRLPQLVCLSGQVHLALQDSEDTTNVTLSLLDFSGVSFTPPSPGLLLLNTYRLSSDSISFNWHSNEFYEADVGYQRVNKIDYSGDGIVTGVS